MSAGFTGVSGFAEVFGPADWSGGAVVLADSGGTPVATLTMRHDSAASACRKLADAGAAMFGGVWSTYPDASGQAVVSGVDADAAFTIYASGAAIALTGLPSVATAGPVVTGTAAHSGGTYPSGGLVIDGVQVKSSGGAPVADDAHGASAVRDVTRHNVEARGTLQELYTLEASTAGVYDVWTDAGYHRPPRLLIQSWRRAPYRALRDPSVMVSTTQALAVIQ